MNKLDRYKTILAKNDDQRILSFCDYLIFKFISYDVNNLDSEKVRVLLKVLLERIEVARHSMNLELMYSLKKVKYDILVILDIIEGEIIIT